MAKDPVLVVLQLSGGNDYMNTVVPYSNSLYWEIGRASCRERVSSPV